MKIIFYATLVLMLVGNIAFAKGPTMQDGTDWNGWTESAKGHYILGWMSCGLQAGIITAIDNYNNSSRLESNKHIMERFRSQGIVLFDIAIRDIIDTINNLYLDPRLRPMQISEVMSLMVGRLKLGWTMGDLDKVISLKIKQKECVKKQDAQGKYLDECNRINKELNTYYHITESE